MTGGQESKLKFSFLVDKSVNIEYRGIMKPLGDVIRQARKRQALSLRAVASGIGVNAAHLSRVETGKVKPSARLIERLARVLGLDADQLLLMSGRVPHDLRPAAEAQAQRFIAALQNVESLGVREDRGRYDTALVLCSESRAVEDGFPFDEISDVADIESWRKEVYRPIYHIHKWWAQRLGSVFRAAILAAAVPSALQVMDLFYQPVRLPGLVVFDPFMGSGTIAGEAHKLGCATIARDINPVAHFAVRTALGPVKRSQVENAFAIVRDAVEADLRALYQERDENGRMREALYFFWVKVLPCPKCETQVDLFSTYIFARHTYPQKYPEAHALCSRCGAIQEVRYDCRRMECTACQHVFDPSRGPARRATAVCPACNEEFVIARTARALGQPPQHRLYAKMVLTGNGRKEYVPSTEQDTARYRKAEEELRTMPDAFPVVEIPDGYNTRQVLNYGYRYWHQMFNSRQLLGFAVLARAISRLPSSEARDALICLLSGALEFNNMFASYKGEGTGAVRHMFSHHILKPERMPIEANIWGTEKSSGAFSTLYRSRLLQAMKYREAPFEVKVRHSTSGRSGTKVFGVSSPMGGPILDKYPADGLRPGSLYISCGDSSATDIPAGSVDLIVTDPPFFDNVHYSELADFFYVWLRHWRAVNETEATTRRREEVQSADANVFAGNLGKVLRECYRVLKSEGLLVFSYHHSREEGWSALADAVLGSGFAFMQAHPVKSEMSVAAPKSQTSEPIDIDVLLVCRKRDRDTRPGHSLEATFKSAHRAAGDRIAKFNSQGRMLSRSDVRVVLSSQLLVKVTPGRSPKEAVQILKDLGSRVGQCAAALHASQSAHEKAARVDQHLLFPALP